MLTTAKFSSRDFDLHRAAEKGYEVRTIEIGEGTPPAILIIEPPGRDNKPSAKGYSGKRGKSDFYHYYSSPEKMEEALDRYINALKESAASKAQREAKKKELNSGPVPIEVGDIFYDSWGYEQTNVTFMQVVAVRGKAVDLREIHSAQVEGTTYSHGMACMVVASPDSFKDDKIVTKIARVSEYGVRLGDFTKDTPGKQHYCSWYA